MKKKILYVFVLVFYVLVVCTFLSEKIETEMYTQVEVSERKIIGHGVNTYSSSAEVLFSDEEGYHLYEVTEGKGWQAKQVIREIPTNIWGWESDTKITLPGRKNYILVESASRMPVEGYGVEIVKRLAKTKDYVPETDQYLVVYPDGAAEFLEIEDAEYPFMEHRAKQLSGDSKAKDGRIFSMTELEDFVEQLPRVAVLAIYLIFPIAIWVVSYPMLAASDKYGGVLCLNLIMTAGFLLGSVRMLGQIDFPASLMPTDSIFDFLHYQQEFAIIRNAQASLGMENNNLVGMLTAANARMAGIVGVGIVAMVIFTIMELCLLYCMNAEKRKKFAKTA